MHGQQPREEFRVGDASIDFEHQDLFERINDLHAECLKLANADDIEDCLGKLHARLSAHFALEEKMMRDADYVGYGAHKDDHEALLDQLAEIIDAVELKGTYDDHALSAVLNLWFSDHFRTHDAKLHGRL